MTKKEIAKRAVEALKKEYPDAVCSLVAGDPFQLLVATRLSAQCTDARVNLVTPALFEKYPTTKAFAEADVSDVEDLIHSCGFFRSKAKDIIGAAQGVLERFDGRVPDTIEELTTLPGVGRKTANLIVGDVYGKPAVVADTHLIRISNRLGLLPQDGASRTCGVYFSKGTLRRVLYERFLQKEDINRLRRKQLKGR